MLPKINPASTTAWQLLHHHANELRNKHMKDMFREDPDRYKKFALCLDEMVFDYSKNIITEKTIKLLVQLAEECRLPEAMKAMYQGDKINETEKRSVLHIALRNSSNYPIYAEGSDVMPLVKAVLQKMSSFCHAVHKGKFRGYTGKRIKYIVNIGIGDSDLGPLKVTEALKPFQIDGIDT